MDFWVGPNDVVIRKKVGEAELLHPLAVRAHSAGIATDLSLREDHADSHVPDLPYSAPQTTLLAVVPSARHDMGDQRLERSVRVR
jgi:hypothetical protein